MSDRVISMKLEIASVMMNVVSAYAQQVECEMEEKEEFWSELDEWWRVYPRRRERCNLKEIGDCKVVVGENVARQYQMVVCRMTLETKKRKRMKAEPKIKWWNLTKEDCVGFREELRQVLGGNEELPDGWEVLGTTAEVARETARKVFGVSPGQRKEDKETWWWDEDVQESIQRKRLAKKWDSQRDEESRQEYKEKRVKVKKRKQAMEKSVIWGDL
eukprot:superscaffoldBa00015694_g26675